MDEGTGFRTFIIAVVFAIDQYLPGHAVDTAVATLVEVTEIVTGAGGTATQAASLEPQEAKAKLERLKSDPEWRAKFAAGDAKAMQEFHALHKSITGGK